MKLVYVNKGTPSVFDSQILAFLEYIEKMNFFEEVILFNGVKCKAEKDIILNKTKSSNFRVLFFKSFPNYNFYNWHQRKHLSKVLKNIELKNSIIHIRGEILFWHIIKTIPEIQNNILIDVRGASKEEILEYSNLSIIKKKLKLWNYIKATKSLSLSKNISFVSNSLCQHINIGNALKYAKISINHCIASEHFRYDLIAREKIRLQLGVRKDEILLVFTSGGNANWQNIGAVQYFSNLGVKILNLSKINIIDKNVINLFVDYKQVYQYLSAADTGLIWREKSITNKVASPVKYSEYLASGLPVISNRNVDLITEYNNKFSLGLLFDNLMDIAYADLIKLKMMDRKRIEQIGQQLFGINNISESYRHIYSKISNY